MRRWFWSVQRMVWSLPMLRERRKPRVSSWWFVALAAALAVSSGCSTQRHARTALDVTSRALVEVDNAIAPAYHDYAERQLSEAADLADYQHRMERWNHVEEAARVAHEALLAAQSGLDAGGADGVLPILGCLSDGLGNLSNALAAVGVRLPPKMRRALELLRELAPSCRQETP